ncbi:hypothetical protein FHR83_006778 [Actinoplanes campanulatus]|uniref:MarR family transcriptional regulator n=1 Tax=Actinoplanes campanulatus TaxID=113559 RepID=A0A7W5FI25_9ACTN|nr:hypothetical protein [Actinoplanes campanulatus]MBB3099072.1 hypothetical protein [Actinoplanes campanulatus]GGN39161.1 hypothetical protein GCM10010109_66800 [Actinoplanes campanulatus]GID40229.1 hypothetical protein Aca09nite_67350 [Actinoplanes campanulatus]
MTAITLDLVLAVHAAADLGGDTGLTVDSIAAMTNLAVEDAEQALESGARRGIVSRLGDGRWIAWPICPTCGYGADDRHHSTDHPQPGVCETHPVDYCAGYPLPR